MQEQPRPLCPWTVKRLRHRGCGEIREYRDSLTVGWGDADYTREWVIDYCDGCGKDLDLIPDEEIEEVLR